MDNNNDLIVNDLKINSVIQTYLKDTIVWTKLIAVIGIVCSVLMFSACLLMLFVGFKYSGNAESVFIAIAYLVLGIVVFFLSNLLLRFTKKTKQSLNNNDQADLEEGFKNLLAYFRTWAIATIVTIVLSILGIIAVFALVPFGR